PDGESGADGERRRGVGQGVRVDAARDAEAAEGVRELHFDSEFFADNARESGRPRAAAAEINLLDAALVGHVAVEAQGPADLGREIFGRRLEQVFDLGLFFRVGSPADFERFRLIVRELQSVDQRLGERYAADRQVAGERRYAVLQNVDARVARAHVDEPDDTARLELVVDLEHILHRKVIDVDDGGNELGILDRLRVAVDDVFFHRDQHDVDLVAVFNVVERLVIEVDVLERVRNQLARLEFDVRVELLLALRRQLDFLDDRNATGDRRNHLL